MHALVPVMGSHLMATPLGFFERVREELGHEAAGDHSCFDPASIQNPAVAETQNWLHTSEFEIDSSIGRRRLDPMGSSLFSFLALWLFISFLLGGQPRPLQSTSWSE